MKDQLLLFWERIITIKYPLYRETKVLIIFIFVYLFQSELKVYIRGTLHTEEKNESALIWSKY